MDWIRAHYDRVALIAASSFLLLCLASVWRKSAHFQTEFAASRSALAPKTASPPAKAVEIEAARQKLNHSPQWTFSGRSGLFVPEKHFVGANGLLGTWERAELRT